uniref:kelch repeat and BTB domain-containing protein 11 n=1 Tax=Pristiophorus japonicus TaxID=55135 RepID=UPI00398E4B70
MDHPGQRLFIVTSTTPLQRNENLDVESLLISIPGSPFPGESNNGVKAEKHRGGQTLTRAHIEHNKTLGAEGTETVACLPTASQVGFEQRGGESACWAENDLQKKLCAGELAKELARRGAGAGAGAEGEGELWWGESAGCAAGVEVGEAGAGGRRVAADTTPRGLTGAAGSENGVGRSLAAAVHARGTGACGQRAGGAAGADMETGGGRVRAGSGSPSAAAGGTTTPDDWEPGSSSCSFGSSLCFSAPSSDDQEPAAGSSPRVVKSQRQINNSTPGEVEEEERVAAAHWSLEPASRAAEGAEAAGEEEEEEEEDEGAEAGSGPSPPPDLVIEVAGRRIQAHQAVLAARSDYFRARRGRRQLALRGVSLAALRVLLDYAYAGGGGGGLRAMAGVSRVSGPGQAAEVLAAARLLQMPGAAQACAEALEGRLELRNCLELLGLARAQRLAGLRRAAYRFMSDHYLAVLREPAVYGRLSGAERELILRRREVEGAGGGVNSAGGERCLVLADISDVYERRLGGGSAGSSRPESRESSRPQSPELSCLSCPAADTERWLYRHDAAADQWKPLSRLPEAVAARSRGCGLCALHNYLFVAGGTTAGGATAAEPSARVFAYNAATGGWAEVRPMRQARSQLQLVALDGLLYAVGGECLLSVERYDPRADRWSPAAPLPRGAFAVAHQAAACSGRIYVTGGSLFRRLLSYDPRRDEWLECPGSRGAGGGGRSRAGGGGGGGRSADLVARGHCLYRFELDRGQRGLSVCRYNTVARLWSECTALQPLPPQPQLLLPFRCALLGRTVYCVNRACTLRFVLPEDEQAASATTTPPGAFHSLPLQPCAEAKGLLFPVVLTLPEKPPKKL